MDSLTLSRRKAAVALGVGAVLTATGLAWAAPLHPAAITVLAFALAWASIVDVDRLVLPDAITLGLILLGLVVRSQDGMIGLTPYVLGVVLGFVTLGSTATVYQWLRGRSGLGMGDAKLFSAAGAWLGAESLAPILLLASSSALMWLLLQRVFGRYRPKTQIPFGPFLVIGIWTVLVAGTGV